jgi:preprotein translocase subunit SecD
LKRSELWGLIIILALFGFCLWVLLPPDSQRLGRNGIALGLDLKGGSYLLYKADLSKKDPALTDQDAINAVINKIQYRVNSFGVAEPIIQQQGTDLIVVQLPGVTNINQAVELIGQTALLAIKEGQYGTDGKQVVDDKGNPVWIPAKGTNASGQEEELTSKYLKPNAQVVLGDNNLPEVAFEWNPEGAVLFEQITTRNIQKPIAIYRDTEQVSVATVQAVISDKGVITGLDVEEARRLAIQLNSGSLDVPLAVQQRWDVDATLGADSLQRSLLAGYIGLALVIIFMIAYYRVPGVIAAIALAMYGAFVLTIFKLWPITLTLPGIAGFVVSLGMAVDANVLIFERMKEELRAGRTIGAAVEAGFNRAWSAIRDSNITTMIACAVLFWLGGTFGAFMVRGFAVTLFIGVLVSMFTAITCSRTLLRVLVASHWITGLSAYGVKVVKK